jgi:GTP-binding protein
MMMMMARFTSDSPTAPMRLKEKAFTLSQYNPETMPVLAIIGRPNVGKSTLLNRFLGRRFNIVDDQPGVTRDRSFHPMVWNGKPFLVMDTGGVHEEAEDPFCKLINQQVKEAIQEADALIFIVDGKTGITEDDERLAKWIRQSGKPYRLVVNKVDKIEEASLCFEFYNLGMGDPMAISAQQGSTTVGDLLDTMITLFPEHKKAPPSPAVLAEEHPINIALVGRPNVGKSSLLNAIVGHNRTIVSDISGTTRDAIDIPFTYEDKPYLLVDTAGIRRRTKVDYGVELFSVDRSVESINKCDIAVLVIDATEPIADQDKRIFNKALEAGKGLIIAVNKWDLVPNKTPKSTAEFHKNLLAEVPSLVFVPIVFISAMNQQRVHTVLELAQTVYANSKRRLGTSIVNQVIGDAVQQNLPATIKNRKLKILYATQVSSEPPTFVLFVNDPKLMKESYQRYLERKMRAAAEFEGVPIRFLLKVRSEKAR